MEAFLVVCSHGLTQQIMFNRYLKEKNNVMVSIKKLLNSPKWSQDSTTMLYIPNFFFQLFNILNVTMKTFS